MEEIGRGEDGRNWGRRGGEGRVENIGVRGRGGREGRGGWKNRKGGKDERKVGEDKKEVKEKWKKEIKKDGRRLKD